MQGVLIALEAEQTVERFHWRYEASQAEVHLRRDSASILFGMLERLEIQKCQDHRLMAIRVGLLASGSACH